jgi:bifunctional ADP-heptose synthase (sugar kinase/adenylyltransferase)
LPQRAYDRLLAGLNSGVSMHRLKGTERRARRSTGGTLKGVDFLRIFEEDTPAIKVITQ